MIDQRPVAKSICLNTLFRDIAGARNQSGAEMKFMLPTYGKYVDIQLLFVCQKVFYYQLAPRIYKQKLHVSIFSTHGTREVHFGITLVSSTSMLQLFAATD